MPNAVMIAGNAGRQGRHLRLRVVETQRNAMIGESRKAA
ncbi:hypothetical protein BLA23254_02436 [Burkholderia lata]|uniref:Uncharacterized protein n=1 Tax=Burkholderia lata (strain ATCC 17760 / DSM 23089 / LMG 22485 / NCIMB 9086 / R18194 / 383) TaxID=482957 RepID=A0A6P2KDV7_BURL3|nr:hypothetical protein BLA23254_02436 [Burkholderia lata]